MTFEPALVRSTMQYAGKIYRYTGDIPNNEVSRDAFRAHCTRRGRLCRIIRDKENPKIAITYTSDKRKKKGRK